MIPGSLLIWSFKVVLTLIILGDSLQMQMLCIEENKSHIWRSVVYESPPPWSHAWYCWMLPPPPAPGSPSHLPPQAPSNCIFTVSIPKSIFYLPFNCWCFQGDHPWFFSLLKPRPPPSHRIHIDFCGSDSCLSLIYPYLSGETTFRSPKITLPVTYWISPLGIFLSTSMQNLNIWIHFSIFSIKPCKPALPRAFLVFAVCGPFDHAQACSRLLFPGGDLSLTDSS